jgi:hypothetical protein
MTEGNPTRRFTVRVDGDDWQETASLSEAGADDRVFSIDDATGRVAFGDGTHGVRPPDDAVVSIAYRDGEGAAGNTEVSITTRWPPVDRRYFVGVSSDGVRIGAIGGGVERLSGAKRLSYFEGQRLSASDFRAEQEYLIGRRRLHNRVLHGFGVAGGLSVTIAGGASPPLVVIGAGLALDRYGREVELDAPVALAIGSADCPQYVIVEYLEREVDAVPSSVDGAGTVASRIAEGASIRLSRVAVTDGGVVIARLLPDSTGWKVDDAFQPATCNRPPA